MIYVRAGVYAEGPTDYQFLRPLLDRLLDTLAAPLFAGNYEIADTIGIDARVARGTRRADRIAAAIAEHADACELFYALFGECVRFAALRALPAFRRFETELVEALHQVATSQGYPT